MQADYELSAPSLNFKSLLVNRPMGESFYGENVDVCLYAEDLVIQLRVLRLEVDLAEG